MDGDLYEPRACLVLFLGLVLVHAVQEGYSQMSRKRLKDTAIGRTLTGKNVAGRIIHGVLDVLPIPQVHEVIGGVIEETGRSGRSSTEVVGDAVRRIDWFRLVVGLVIAWAILTGKVTPESFDQLMQLFRS